MVHRFFIFLFIESLILLSVSCSPEQPGGASIGGSQVEPPADMTAISVVPLPNGVARRRWVTLEWDQPIGGGPAAYVIMTKRIGNDEDENDENGYVEIGSTPKPNEQYIEMEPVVANTRVISDSQDDETKEISNKVRVRLNGFSNGKAYKVKIYLKNAAGVGKFEVSEKIKFDAGPPDQIYIEEKGVDIVPTQNGEVIIEWTAPKQEEGADKIIGYDVYVRTEGFRATPALATTETAPGIKMFKTAKDGESLEPLCVDDTEEQQNIDCENRIPSRAPPEARLVVLEDLIFGQDYKVWIIPVNKYGASEIIEEAGVRISLESVTSPGVVKNLSIGYKETKVGLGPESVVQLTWDEGLDGGSAITGYEVYSFHNGEFQFIQLAKDSSDEKITTDLTSASRDVKIINLELYKQYTFGVIAINSVPETPSSKQQRLKLPGATVEINNTNVHPGDDLLKNLQIVYKKDSDGSNKRIELRWNKPVVDINLDNFGVINGAAVTSTSDIKVTQEGQFLKTIIPNFPSETQCNLNSGTLNFATECSIRFHVNIRAWNPEKSDFEITPNNQLTFYIVPQETVYVMDSNNYFKDGKAIMFDFFEHDYYLSMVSMNNAVYGDIDQKYLNGFTDIGNNYRATQAQSFESTTIDGKDILGRVSNEITDTNRTRIDGRSLVIAENTKYKLEPSFTNVTAIIIIFEGEITFPVTQWGSSIVGDSFAPKANNIANGYGGIGHKFGFIGRSESSSGFQGFTNFYVNGDTELTGDDVSGLSVRVLNEHLNKTGKNIMLIEQPFGLEQASNIDLLFASAIGRSWKLKLHKLILLKSNGTKSYKHLMKPLMEANNITAPDGN